MAVPRDVDDWRKGGARLDIARVILNWLAGRRRQAIELKEKAVAYNCSIVDVLMRHLFDHIRDRRQIKFWSRTQHIGRSENNRIDTFSE
jgi:hypothetical protein